MFVSPTALSWAALMNMMCVCARVDGWKSCEYWPKRKRERGAKTVKRSPRGGSGIINVLFVGWSYPRWPGDWRRDRLPRATPVDRSLIRRVAGLLADKRASGVAFADLCQSAAAGVWGHRHRVRLPGSRSCSASRRCGRSPSWSRPLIKPIVARPSVHPLHGSSDRPGTGRRRRCRWGAAESSDLRWLNDLGLSPAGLAVIHLVFYVDTGLAVHTILDLTFRRAGSTLNYRRAFTSWMSRVVDILVIYVTIWRR